MIITMIFFKNVYILGPNTGGGGAHTSTPTQAPTQVSTQASTHAPTPAPPTTTVPGKYI